MLSARPVVRFPASERHCRWPVPVHTAWWTEVCRRLACGPLWQQHGHWPGVEPASSVLLVKCHTCCASPPPLPPPTQHTVSVSVHSWKLHSTLFGEQVPRAPMLVTTPNVVTRIVCWICLSKQARYEGIGRAHPRGDLTPVAKNLFSRKYTWVLLQLAKCS